MSTQSLLKEVRGLRKDLKTLTKQMAALAKFHEQMGNTIAHELRCIREAVSPVRTGESTGTDIRENNTSHSEDDAPSVEGPLGNRADDET